MTVSPDVEIYNLALDELGQLPITSFADNVPAAENSERRYKQTIGFLLSLHPWTFCTTRSQLTRLTEESATGYKYQFDVPGAEALYGVYANSRYDYRITDYEFIDRQVHANYTELWATIRRAVSPERWEPYFRELAICALAAKACMQHTGNAAFKARLDQKAFGGPGENGMGGLVATAKNLDSQNSRGGRLDLADGDLIEVRDSHRGIRDAQTYTFTSEF